MVLFAVADLEMLKFLNGKMKFQRAYALNAERALDLARREQPKVVVLDVELGGNLLRAIDLIPQFRSRAPCCEVVVLSRRPSKRELRELGTLGAFDCVGREDPRLLPKLLDAISQAWDAADASILNARSREASNPDSDRGRSAAAAGAKKPPLH